MKRKQELLRATNLLAEINPCCSVNRTQWLLVGRALRTICRGGSDLLPAYIQWVKDGNRNFNAKQNDLALGLGRSPHVIIGQGGGSSVDRSGILSSDACVKAWEAMRPVTNCDHPAIAQARVYLREAADEQQVASFLADTRAARSSSRWQAGRGRGERLSSRDNDALNRRQGVSGQGHSTRARLSAVAQGVLDSIRQLLDQRALVFLTHEYAAPNSEKVASMEPPHQSYGVAADGRGAGGGGGDGEAAAEQQGQGLGRGDFERVPEPEPLPVPVVSYEINRSARGGRGAVDGRIDIKESLTLAADDAASGSMVDLGKFIGSEEMKAYIIAGDVLNLGSAAVPLLRAHGSRGTAGSAGYEHAYDDGGETPLGVSARSYGREQQGNEEDSGCVLVLAVDLLYARLRVALCPAVPRCWDGPPSTQAFWVSKNRIACRLHVG